MTTQPAPAAGQPPIVDRELYVGDPEISGAPLSPDGRFIAFLRPLEGTRNIWVKRFDEPFEKARPITADTRRPIGSFFWSRDSRAVLHVQDQGGDENYNVCAVDLMRLTLVDVATGAETVVESDPQKRVDIDSAILSEKTDELMATVYVDDRRRLYFKDPAFEAHFAFVSKQLPGRELKFRSPTADEQRWVVSAASDIEPGGAYLYDRLAKTLTLQSRIYEKLPRTTLAPMTPVRYPSSDGLEIPAYLTLPKGVTPKGLPAIVLPHGGPWARDLWGYDALAQFPATRGYAVLQPNFRGSTGYGRRFLDAGNQAVGREDAGRYRLGREVPRRQGHRRPQAHLDPRGIVRRLRHARRRGLHA